MDVDIMYVAGRRSPKHKHHLEATIETLISLFVYSYCEFNLTLYVVNTGDAFPSSIPLDNFNDLSEKIIFADNTDQDFKCILPAIKIKSENTFIAGLCAVLRWAIKSHIISFPNHYSECLLGFRGGCLMACTESSIWTKFCELQLPSAVVETYSFLKDGMSCKKVPEALVILEVHLKQPVRTHNILKRKIDVAKKVTQNKEIATDSSTDMDFILYENKGNNVSVHPHDAIAQLKSMTITEKSDEFCLAHCYMEGIDLTLADMIVFPCVYYLLENLPIGARKHLENVKKWFQRMLLDEHIQKASNRCGIMLTKDVAAEHSENNDSVIMPQVEQKSLYKRDPLHTKVKVKNQSVDKILSALKNANISPEYSSSCCTTLNWENLPAMLHPACGDLPKTRVDRKCQQLESMLNGVLKIASDGQTIVEFCSGGGHVGLLIAYHLPNCNVILIENKESSMMRAINRAQALNLKNVSFYQCNMDYFIGSFDIGVALHACGVATDLVIQQCLKENASFVCCPCCYGGVQNTHLLNYPLSKKFLDTGISYKDYILLAHCADRTEVNTQSAEEGELCMGVVDTDRAYYAEEHNYKVELTTLQPITCSPKHNLLIGISPKCTKHHLSALVLY